jgi:hypothetical protein
VRSVWNRFRIPERLCIYTFRWTPLNTTPRFRDTASQFLAPLEYRIELALYAFKNMVSSQIGGADLAYESHEQDDAEADILSPSVGSSCPRRERNSPFQLGKLPEPESTPSFSDEPVLYTGLFGTSAR